MARISRDVVTQREAEATDAFQKGGSIKDVQEALKTKYGHMMGVKRIYALRKMAKAQAGQTAVVNAEVVESVAATA